MGAQSIPRPDHLAERRNFEGKVMQLLVCGLSIARTDQGEAVMVRIAAQEYHPAGHHGFGVNVGNLKAEHLGVKGCRFFQVADLQDDMAELADMKIDSSRRNHAL